MPPRPFSVRALYRASATLSHAQSIARITYYRLLGATIGTNSRLGSVSITLPEQVCIGNDCQLEDGVRLRPGGPWQQSSIKIGNRCFIGHGTQINVGSPLLIKDDCLIAPGCIFADAQHEFADTEVPIREQGCNYSPIILESDVWLGVGAVILGGATVGTGAIIAAGAVVTKNIPPLEIWAGVPARRIRSRKESDLRIKRK